MEGVLAAFAQFDNDVRSDRTRAGMKAALELGRWVFLAPIGYLNAPRAMGKSLIHDPVRAPLVRRAFEKYATGRFTKEQLLKRARSWGFTNRRDKPLTSQAIGVLLRNQLYAGIVDVPEYGVWGKRGDFEPLISEALFYRVQAVLSGRVPSTTPQQRAHPDFPLRAFVRCDSCGRGLTGSWSKGRSGLRFEMTLREGAAGAGLQVALEADGGGLVSQRDGGHKTPRSITGRMRAPTRIVRGEASVHVVREADVRSRRLRYTAKNVDDVLGWHWAEWCKRAAEGVRNNYCEKRCRTAQRVAKLASRASEENGGFCDLRARVQDDAELLCAACEARLRACGASARNLRGSVTGSSVWLDAQPSMEMTRSLACQP